MSKPSIDISKEGVEMNTKKCLRCGHTWIPRTQKPAECPKCKSYNWNKKEEK